MQFGARKAALEILNILERDLRNSKKPPLEDKVKHFLGKLSVKDKAHFTMLYKGIFRWKNKLDAVISHFSRHKIDKIEIPILNSIRIGLFEVIHLSRIPAYASINECVDLVASYGIKSKAFVNGMLREIERNKEKIPMIPAIKSTTDAITYSMSYSEWFAKKLINDFGKKNAVEFASNLNLEEPLTIRVNPLKTSLKNLIDILLGEEIKAEISRYSPGALIINAKASLFNLDSFKDGLFYVQNTSSQIAGYLLNPRKGEIILDACAAPGGKSTHLAELSKDEAAIYSMDISKKKLALIEENSKRLGIKNIKTFHADAGKALPKELPLEFDKIIIDAPCTALGAIRKNPDIKWTRCEGDFNRMAALQMNILDNTASCLKKDGTLIYTVCTFSKEETFGTVESFLKNNEDFRIDPVSSDEIEKIGKGLSKFLTKDGFLFIPPQESELEAFFIARFRKQ